jgi:rubrerythrin
MEKIKKQLNQEEYLEYIEQWKLENKEEIELGKCKKVFLECLPRVKNRGDINWSNINEIDVYYIYEQLEGYFKILNYNKEKRKINILYNNKNVTLSTNNLSDNNIGFVVNKRTKEFKIEIGARFKDDKRDITITDREYRKKERKDKKRETQKWYKYICNKCGYEGWITQGDIIRGNGCPCCCLSAQTVVEGINDIPTVANWMIPFFQGGYEEAKLYSYGSGKKINPVCPDCGEIGRISVSICNIYKHKGFGCVCGDGIKYPNKFAFNMLKQLNIDFINEYSPKWIKGKKYDFYFELNNKEYILEMDGGFHEKDNTISGQTKEESKAIDDYKDEQAKLHGIEVIRIDCNYLDIEKRCNYIKNNILNNKRLNVLFDLRSIDWAIVEEFAISNLIKVASEYKKKCPDLTTKDIALKMSVDRATITKWLKKGNELGWCHYDAEEESLKGRSYSGKLNGVPVLIIKNISEYYIFNSSHEAERESEKILGIKLTFGKVCRACRESVKYKGLICKYISNLTSEEYIKYDIENKLKKLNNVKNINEI